MAVRAEGNGTTAGVDDSYQYAESDYSVGPEADAPIGTGCKGPPGGTFLPGGLVHGCWCFLPGNAYCGMLVGMPMRSGGGIFRVRPNSRRAASTASERFHQSWMAES